MRSDLQQRAWQRPRVRRASTTGLTPVRSEFQAGSCSVEASSHDGRLHVA
jgi:hypothetical protein